MDVQAVRKFLFWCFLLDMGLLAFWFLWFVSARGWVYRLHARWFRLSPERFDAIHYAAMAGLKIAAVVFFFVPYLALAIAA